MTEIRISRVSDAAPHNFSRDWFVVITDPTGSETLVSVADEPTAQAVAHLLRGEDWHNLPTVMPKVAAAGEAATLTPEPTP